LIKESFAEENYTWAYVIKEHQKKIFLYYHIRLKIPRA